MQPALDAAVVLVDRGLGDVRLGFAEAAQIGAHDAMPGVAEEIGEARHRAERARARERPVRARSRSCERARPAGSCAVHTISAPSPARTTKARRVMRAPRPAPRPRRPAPRPSRAPAGAGGGTGRRSRARCAAPWRGRPRSASRAAGWLPLSPRQSAGGKRSPSSTIGLAGVELCHERVTVVVLARGRPSAHALGDLAAQVLAQRRAHVEAGVDEQQRVGRRRLRRRRAPARRRSAPRSAAGAPRGSAARARAGRRGCRRRASAATSPRTRARSRRCRADRPAGRRGRRPRVRARAGRARAGRAPHRRRAARRRARRAARRADRRRCRRGRRWGRRRHSRGRLTTHHATTAGGRVASRVPRGVSSRGCRCVPLAIAFGATSIPVATALIAAAFAARLGGGALARPAAHRACWALGFACFAAGAAAEAYGAAYGWSPVTFRIYYLTGGVLAVGLLGLGATWLHARRDVALFVSGAVLATLDRGGRRRAQRRRRRRAAGGGRTAPAAQQRADRPRIPVRDRAQHARHDRAARRHRALAAAPRARRRQSAGRRRRARRREQRHADARSATPTASCSARSSRAS